jgi:hypothetical protein
MELMEAKKILEAQKIARMQARLASQQGSTADLIGQAFNQGLFLSPLKESQTIQTTKNYSEFNQRRDHHSN